MIPVDTERLIEIIVEELRRVLGSDAAGGAAAPVQASPPSPQTATKEANPAGSADPPKAANRASAAPATPSMGQCDGSPECPYRDEAPQTGKTPYEFTEDIEEICSRPALVLFSRTRREMEGIYQSLDRLKAAGYPFSISYCDNFAEYHDVGALAKRFDAPVLAPMEPEQVAEITGRIELVIWASVSPNTSQILLEGKTHTQPAAFLHQALKTRLPLIGVAPEGWNDGPRFSGLDDQTREFFSDYALLENRGLRNVSPERLAEEAEAILRHVDPSFQRRLPRPEEPEKRAFITLQDAEDFLKSSKTVIPVYGPCHLTDLAKDFIRAHGMSLEEQ